MALRALVLQHGSSLQNRSTVARLFTSRKKWRKCFYGTHERKSKYRHFKSSGLANFDPAKALFLKKIGRRNEVARSSCTFFRRALANVARRSECSKRPFAQPTTWLTTRLRFCHHFNPLPLLSPEASTWAPSSTKVPASYSEVV